MRSGSSRRVRQTIFTVVEKQQVIIFRDRQSMFANRRKSVSAERKRKVSQRRELVPLLGIVTKNPFDSTCCVIKSDNEIFPTGYQ